MLAPVIKICMSAALAIVPSDCSLSLRNLRTVQIRTVRPAPDLVVWSRLSIAPCASSLA